MSSSLYSWKIRLSNRLATVHVLKAVRDILDFGLTTLADPNLLHNLLLTRERWDRTIWRQVYSSSGFFPQNCVHRKKKKKKLEAYHLVPGEWFPRMCFSSKIIRLHAREQKVRERRRTVTIGGSHLAFHLACIMIATNRMESKSRFLDNKCTSSEESCVRAVSYSKSQACFPPREQRRQG